MGQYTPPAGGEPPLDFRRIGNCFFRTTDTPASLSERLCLRPRDGDWERFVRLFTPLLFRWAHRFGVPAADTEDALQGVFVLLFDKPPRFVPRVQAFDDRIVPSFLTTLASTEADGSQVLISTSFAPTLSAGGRFVAFTSDATTFGAGNGVRDVFLYDRVANTTTLMSADASGTAGNGSSDGVAISGNGRYVAFGSISNNLVAGDGNGQLDVFVKDRVTGTVTRVSVATAGTEGNSASGLGVAVSRDGQFVAYDSTASNLVAGDGNGTFDVFVTQRPLPVAYAVGADPAASPLVNVFGPNGQTNSFLAYPPAYKGGVFVAMGDVTGDGIADVVASTGPGTRGLVRGFSGKTNGQIVADSAPFGNSFTSGVNVG